MVQPQIPKRSAAGRIMNMMSGIIMMMRPHLQVIVDVLALAPPSWGGARSPSMDAVNVIDANGCQSEVYTASFLYHTK